MMPLPHDPVRQPEATIFFHAVLWVTQHIFLFQYEAEGTPKPTFAILFANDGRMLLFFSFLPFILPSSSQ